MIITRMEDKVLRFKKFFDLNFPKVKTFAWQLLKSEEDAEIGRASCRERV